MLLSPVGPEMAPATQVRLLYRLSDPALSELGLEEFLDELLARAQEALSVDTVAILLLDREKDQLVARAAKGVEEEVEQGIRIPIGEVTLASAGHLPPLVVSHQGGRQLDLQPSAPLGALSFGHRPEHTAHLELGETLVMYTDGLVERPGVPVSDSIDLLLNTIAGAATAEEACQLAVQLVPLGGLKDDLAIVALQNSDIPEELVLHVPARPDVLAELRRVLRRWLRDHGASDEEITEITLAANEACANAVEHAYSPAPAQFTFRARAEEGNVVITVTDGGRWREPRGTDRGRGLRIMDAAMEAVEIRGAEGHGTQITMQRRFGT